MHIALSKYIYLLPPLDLIRMICLIRVFKIYFSPFLKLSLNGIIIRFSKFQNICVKKRKLENASEHDVIKVDVVCLSPVMLTLEPAAAAITWCHGFKPPAYFKASMWWNEDIPKDYIRLSKPNICHLNPWEYITF